jgi:enoyl-CoA hydratase/carnithine racemase
MHIDQLSIPNDLAVSAQGHVALVTLRRPPHNFFDLAWIRDLASIFEGLDRQLECRAIVLASEGSSFCAGADFSKPRAQAPAGAAASNPLYDEAVRLFRCCKPVVAAVQGPAVGGGLGLALMADFRVTCPEARFSANFNRLGFHPGFGLSVTLPRVVGVQRASYMFYSGRRVQGEEAFAMGLADRLVAKADVLDAAIAMAQEIATSAPIAVQSTRATLRSGLAEAVRQASSHEGTEQSRHYLTEDFKEGIRAMAERRSPVFVGR